MNFARPLLAALASVFVSSAPAAALTALRRRAVPCLAALACALAWPASLAAQSAPTVAPATAIGLTGFTANWSAVSGATG